MAKIEVVIISSGRYDYLEQTLTSFLNNVEFHDHEISLFLHEDKTVKYCKEKVEAIIDGYRIEGYFLTDTNLGPIGSVRSAWENLLNCDYVFHLEEDFVFLEKIDIDDFISVLENKEFKVSQLLLERDNGAGHSVKKQCGFIDKVIDGVECCYSPTPFFSTNPMLIKKNEIDLILEKTRTAEYDIGLYFHAKECYGCYLGNTNVPNKVKHIGIERIGNYNEF